MPKQLLYEQLDTLSQKEVPDSVAQNLNPKYELRPYQIEAFACFFHCYKNDFPNKASPLHLLFNMATGSGKTLIFGLDHQTHLQNRADSPPLTPQTNHPLERSNPFASLVGRSSRD